MRCCWLALCRCWSCSRESSSVDACALPYPPTAQTSSQSLTTSLEFTACLLVLECPRSSRHESEANRCYCTALVHSLSPLRTRRCCSNRRQLCGIFGRLERSRGSLALSVPSPGHHLRIISHHFLVAFESPRDRRRRRSQGRSQRAAGRRYCKVHYFCVY
ncbi:hypothetical protein BC835DRAFT_187757 [Cytidiella melzeri]|nr:hypothetical protein BC835DRAFT_187757 [Cytidiella melzeri]